MLSRFTVVWEFLVSNPRQPEFEKIYGPKGAWAELFRQGDGYLGTELVRDLDRPGRYLTFDHWTSREALHAFRQDHEIAYSALDKQCEALTEEETLLGHFASVS